VSLSNTDGELATSFDVFKNGSKIDTVAVAAGATVEKIYAMDEDEQATFKATTADGFDSGDVALTNDCTDPGATVFQSCTAGGAFLVLRNSGESGTVFDVAKNGALLEQVAVGAESAVNKTYAMAEDETSTFRATADGFDSGTISLTHDCAPTEVLGAVFEQHRSLPRTGDNPLPLILRSAALLGLGFVILRVRVLLFGREA
jgi:hypothetical protein